MTHLLGKETLFVFSKDCIDVFETLKKKLTEAPILVFPDWNLPFELMCDVSDFAIGVVLGQRKTKHFQPIHYASKTMTEAQIYYTTTEKEMLAVVYAFEKGVVVQEPSEFRTTTSSSQLPQAKDKGKTKMIEPEKPLKKKDQILVDEEIAQRLQEELQAELEEEERLARQKEEAKDR
ncbi:reverse transcriptase domain-containing protein [Tanacetum coccineum]